MKGWVFLPQRCEGAKARFLKMKSYVFGVLGRLRRPFSVGGSIFTV
jgi:hypothetical protein